MQYDEGEELTEEEQHGLLLELLLASRCWCRFSGESTEVDEHADADVELCGGRVCRLSHRARQPFACC